MARGVIYRIYRDAEQAGDPSLAPFDEEELAGVLAGEADCWSILAGKELEDALGRLAESLCGRGAAVDAEEERDEDGAPRLKIDARDAAAFKREWFSGRLERLKEDVSRMGPDEFADERAACRLQQLINIGIGDMACLGYVSGGEGCGGDCMTLDGFVRGLEDGTYYAVSAALMH